MRNGKSLIGMRVISEDDGSDLGRVRDLIFDHDANRLLALLMSEKELFGLIDAQVISWEQISGIGPDAITAQSSKSRVKAGDAPGVKTIMHNTTALSGTRIFTTAGEFLGTLADAYIDETTGSIEGYELSGGFVKDTFAGKKFLPAEYDLSVGKNVALVPPAAAANLESRKDSPLKETLHVAGEKLTETSHTAAQALEAARQKMVESYAHLAHSSVEKQQEFVIGKVAGHDVVIGSAPVTPPVTVEEAVASETPGVVHKGEVITAGHAQQAVASGAMPQLIAAAVSHLAAQSVSTGRESVTGAVEDSNRHLAATGAQWQEQAAAKVIGQPASSEVIAADGEVIVAQGEIITPEIMEHARRADREKDVIAAAGVAYVTQTAQNAAEQVAQAAQNIWEAARGKVAEMTQTAQEKKQEREQQILQERIDYAVGRPVTRVILDRSDAVILNTGDLITNAAVERAREAGVLEVLLNSSLPDKPSAPVSAVVADAVAEGPDGEKLPRSYEIPVEPGVR